jgi:hypothetical protein
MTASLRSPMSIHALVLGDEEKDVDGRDKPGHDRE